MSNKIHWYGERGVVNALITQIASSGTAAGIAFLKCIQWGDGEFKLWLEKITDIEYIVEIGLGRFGDPDLIMVCTTTDEAGSQKKHAFFIEAKVTTYQESYEKGGPSCINRQLTLKYRFAQALQGWSADNRPIVESDQQHSAYYPSSEDGSVIEKSPVPRLIAKQSVLAILRSAGLHDVANQDIHFAAWTWDRESFFTDGWDAFSVSAGRPMFLDTKGNEVLGQLASKVGWLGYQHINKSKSLDELLDASYSNALKSMRSTLVPAEVVTTESNWPRLKSKNIRDLKNAAVTHQLKSLIEQAKAIFDPENVTVYAGSVSVTLLYAGVGYRKVLLKLVPQNHGKTNEKIKLGVSTTLNQDQWAEKTSTEIMGIGAEKVQPFYMFDLEPDDAGNAFAESVFEQLAELMLTNESEDN
ncbi:hypothetical protein N9Y42_06675 [Mariniblastus sp.]|nr:hypothetical protein [Mariniblastus sp.]